uniref:Uncharacterized protein n=1 Tax=Arundo donax TaxID=35708 RepID=A0A0A9D9A4_ARUDO
MVVAAATSWSLARVTIHCRTDPHGPMPSHTSPASISRHRRESIHSLAVCSDSYRHHIRTARCRRPPKHPRVGPPRRGGLASPATPPWRRWTTLARLPPASATTAPLARSQARHRRPCHHGAASTPVRSHGADTPHRHTIADALPPSHAPLRTRSRGVGSRPPTPAGTETASFGADHIHHQPCSNRHRCHQIRPWKPRIWQRRPLIQCLPGLGSLTAHSNVALPTRRPAGCRATAPWGAAPPHRDAAPPPPWGTTPPRRAATTSGRCPSSLGRRVATSMGRRPASPGHCTTTPTGRCPASPTGRRAASPVRRATLPPSCRWAASPGRRATLLGRCAASLDLTDRAAPDAPQAPPPGGKKAPPPPSSRSSGLPLSRSGGSEGKRRREGWRRVAARVPLVTPKPSDARGCICLSTCVRANAMSL